MTRKDRIQHLLITHLLQDGEISLTLPSGIVLEVGVTKLTKHGIEKCEDYCWVSATQEERSTYMDSYNLSLQYPRHGLLLQGDELDPISSLEVI